MTMTDRITYSKSGTTTFDGPSAVEFVRLIVIAQALDFYDKTGMIRMQGWTPTAMLTKASEITGKIEDGNCLFDAQKGSMAALEAAAATLSVRRSAEYLNAPRVQRDMLYRTGLIVPRVGGADHGAADQFAPADLDAFLDRLLDGAKPVKAARAGQVNIPEAAGRAFCMSEEVVRLILDGKLTRKWRLIGERGYMSVLVGVEEVRALVRGPDHGGLTREALKDKLSTTAKVAAALIKHGHLKTIIVVNPVNRCPTVVVPVEEVESFARKYISLFALAKQQGRHFPAVKKELDADGIEPALDPVKTGATFYRRINRIGAAVFSVDQTK
jgi:hypothetical protein